MSSEAGMPTHELTGVLNFRDIGGLPTSDGHLTRPGVVYRSDALEDLTETDVRILSQTMGIGCVIDLRAHVETGGGAPAWAGRTAVKFVNLPLSDGWSDYGALTDEGRRTLMSRKYMSYLDEAGDNVVAALQTIAGNGAERPTIVHCAMGKDRTGVVIALLLSLVGVSREAIVADYLRTARNLDRLMDRVASNETYRDRVKSNPAEVYLAEEHTIALFLDDVDGRFGSVAAWALAQGMQREDVERLRLSLVGVSSSTQRSPTHG